eukprot:354060-Chlamydomonas_euryale.AAC.6
MSVLACRPSAACIGSTSASAVVAASTVAGRFASGLRTPAAHLWVSGTLTAWCSSRVTAAVPAQAEAVRRLAQLSSTTFVLRPVAARRRQGGACINRSARRRRQCARREIAAIRLSLSTRVTRNGAVAAPATIPGDPLALNRDRPAALATEPQPPLRSTHAAISRAAPRGVRRATPPARGVQAFASLRAHLLSTEAQRWPPPQPSRWNAAAAAPPRWPCSSAPSHRRKTSCCCVS